MTCTICAAAPDYVLILNHAATQVAQYPGEPNKQPEKKGYGATAARKNSMQIGTLNNNVALPRTLKTHR